MAEALKRVSSDTKEFLKFYDLYNRKKWSNNDELAVAIGYKTGSAITEITKGRLNINEESYRVFKEKYVKGEADIVKVNGEIHNARKNSPSSNSLIPFYNADFMAGTGVENYEDGTIYPEYYLDVPEFSGCIAFRAYSDSMEKIIRSGSILFGRKIEDWQDHLEYGQIYGITLWDTRRYLKRIRRFKEDHKNRFLLTSENEIYDDYDIPKKVIKNIWLIDGWIIKTT